MGQLINLTGQRFSRLVVVERAELKIKKRGDSARWLCQCDCGKTTIVGANNLKHKSVKSCGCLYEELRGKTHFIHGGTGTRTFKIWCSMRKRCREADNIHYAGRGIQVCNRWEESFANFLKDMGEAPDDMSIERVDNNGNYEPSNCIWADDLTQKNNQRSNIRLEWNGTTMTIAQIARAENKNYDGVLYHFHRKQNIAEAVKAATLIKPKHICQN